MTVKLPEKGDIDELTELKRLLARYDNVDLTKRQIGCREVYRFRYNQLNLMVAYIHETVEERFRRLMLEEKIPKSLVGGVMLILKNELIILSNQRFSWNSFVHMCEVNRVYMVWGAAVGLLINCKSRTVDPNVWMTKIIQPLIKLPHQGRLIKNET